MSEWLKVGLCCVLPLLIGGLLLWAALYAGHRDDEHAGRLEGQAPKEGTPWN